MTPGDGIRARRRTASGASSPAGARARAAQVPYLAVLAGVLGGLALAWLSGFKIGAFVMAGSMLAGAAARAFLPESRVGFLATRKRGTDVLMMSALGLGLALLAGFTH